MRTAHCPQQTLTLACILVLILAHCASFSPPPPKPVPEPRPRPAPVAVPPAARSETVLSGNDVSTAAARARRVLARDGLARTEVGYYLDVLQGRLLQVAGNRFTVTRSGERLILRATAASGLLGEGGDLGDGGRESLAAVSTVLAEFRKSLVIVRVSASELGNARQRALATGQQFVPPLARARLLLTVDSTPASGLEIQVEPVVAAN